MPSDFLRLLSDYDALLKQLVALGQSMRFLFALLLASWLWNGVLWFYYARRFSRTNRLLGELLSLHTKLLEVLEEERR